jgi:hypothetical protein
LAFRRMDETQVGVDIHVLPNWQRKIRSARMDLLLAYLRRLIGWKRVQVLEKSATNRIPGTFGQPVSGTIRWLSTGRESRERQRAHTEQQRSSNATSDHRLHSACHITVLSRIRSRPLAPETVKTAHGRTEARIQALVPWLFSQLNALRFVTRHPANVGMHASIPLVDRGARVHRVLAHERELATRSFP